MSVDIFFSFDILMSAMVLLLLGNAPVYRFTNSNRVLTQLHSGR